MKLNVNTFSKFFQDLKTNDVTRVLLILNNCEIIGTISSVKNFKEYENLPLKEVFEKNIALEVGLSNFLSERKSPVNFDALYLKDAKIKTSHNLIYSLREILVNIETINVVIYLNEDQEPF